MKKITLLLFAFFLSFCGYAQFPTPGTEGFENTTGPVSTTNPSVWNLGTGVTGNQWAVFDNGTGTNVSWTINNGVATPPLVCAGTNVAYANRENIGLGNTSEDYLATPLVTVPNNGQLRFTSRTFTNQDQGTIYEIRIAPGNNPANQTNPAAYTLLQQYSEDQLTLDETVTPAFQNNFNICTEKVISLNAYVGQQVYIAFVKRYTQPTTAIGGDRWLLDEVKVVELCLPPTTGNATNIGVDSAQLTWSNPSGATSWEIEIIPAASNPTGSGLIYNNATPTYLATQTASGSPLVQTPLVQTTAYKYYVRSICTGNNPSAWAGPFNFTTISPGLTCNAPIIIPGVTPYTTSNNTANFADTYDVTQPGACAGTNTNYMTGNDVFYSFTPAVTGSYTITMTPNGTRSGIFVYQGCGNVGVSCLGGVANTGTAPRIITLNLTAGTQYSIVLSSSITQTYAYSLLIVLNSCTNFTATYSVVSNCVTGTGFFATANVTNMGSATTIVATDNQGSAPQTISANGLITFGPYANGTNVSLHLENQTDQNCFSNSANLTQQFCPFTNDLCANAIPLTCGVPVTQTTVGATTTGAPPTCVVAGGSGGLWYSYMGTGDVVTFSLCGSAFNTRLQVVTGTCGSFTCVAGNDDFAACGTSSQVQFISTAGVLYYVYVYGATGAQGIFTLTTTCVTAPPLPANNNCSTATITPVNQNGLCTQIVSGTVNGATPSPEGGTSCVGTEDDDVWFQFTALQTSEIITLSNITGSTTDLVHAVYSTTNPTSPCGALTLKYCSDPDQSLATGLTIGGVYLIRVYSSTATILQTTTFDLCVSNLPDAPANDNCATAIVAPVNTDGSCAQIVSGTVNGATASAEGGTTCAGTEDDDVWFQFTANQASELITISNVAGTTLDLNHAVYTTTNQASPCGALTLKYCSDPNLSVATGLTPGNVYLIRVYSATAAILQNITFDLCVSNMPPPPSNDNCSGATVVQVSQNLACSLPSSGTITSATASTGLPIGTCTGTADDDVWFQFTAISTAHIVNLQNIVGTVTALNYAVYLGNSCTGTNTPIGCFTTASNQVSGLIPGQVYFIRVYTSGSTAQVANFDICITSPSVCSNAQPFCGDTGFTYTNSVGITSLGQIGCLFTTPNPAFFFLQIDQNGPLDLQISQTSTATGNGIDVDFIAYGPYASMAAACVGAPLLTPTVACSYSAAPIENFTIPSASIGQIYVVMITNFSNQPGTVSFTQTNNSSTTSGSTDCSIVCSVELGPNQVLCNATSHTITASNNNADSYAWYFNNSATPIPGQTTSSLVVTQTGVYKCIVQCGLNSSQDTVTITFNNAVADIIPSGTYCNSYTLPVLSANNSYYTAAGGPTGTGTLLTAGSVITSTQTIYVYAQTGSAPNFCTNESSFTVTINHTPVIAPISNIIVCDSYTLLPLTVGNYYTATGGPAGTGTMLNAGDNITTLGTTTVYVYAETGTTPNCSAETNFTVTINSITAEILSDVTVCDSYPLPTLPAGNNYYTATGGPTGTGTLLTAGTAITSTQTVYIYAESGTTPNCTDESSFVVTINQTPVIAPITNVIACDSYALLPLAVGNYYTATGGPTGTGTMLNAGDSITTSGTTTVYVYAQTSTIPNCSSETSFTVTINSITADVKTNVTACDNYTLPTLSANNSYYTATGGPTGTGTLLTAGTALTSTQTVFIYAESGTTPNCTDESSFVVTINQTPVLGSFPDVDECGSYTLPTLSVGNYFAQSGGQSPITDLTLTTTKTVYVYAQTGTNPNCFAEKSFVVTITALPQFTITGGCVGGSYTLEAVGANYNAADADYQWSTSGNSNAGSNATLVVTQAANYTCEVTVNNCTTTKVFDASEVGCMIPKGISPNNDGTNDSFDLRGFNVKVLSIYNRYGTKVYSRTDYTNQWTGLSDSGHELPDGTYYFVIERDNAETKSGWVYINRQKN